LFVIIIILILSLLCIKKEEETTTTEIMEESKEAKFWMRVEDGLVVKTWMLILLPASSKI